jgi:hypothetical protein
MQIHVHHCLDLPAWHFSQKLPCSTDELHSHAWPEAVLQPVQQPLNLACRVLYAAAAMVLSRNASTTTTWRA